MKTNIVLVLTLLMSIIGCGSNPKQPVEDTCERGTELCRCTMTNSCNSGLDCVLGNCVETIVAADGDADSDTDSDADSDADVDADSDSDSDADTDADSDSDSDTDADADADSDADTDSDADSDADGDGDADTDADSDADGDADSPHACADVYSQETLTEWEIDIEPAELLALQEEHTNWEAREIQGLDTKPFHPAIIRLGNEEIAGAVCLYGNPSSSWQQSKMQLMLSFDTYDETSRFHGLRKTILEASPYDYSMLHSRIGYSVMRDLGIPAACSNNARLTINDQYYGVYTHTENLDHEFLVRNFTTVIDDNLYRYGDWSGDTHDVDILFSMNDLTDIRSNVDLFEVTQEWAAEAVMPHGNGYWNGSSNFYLYNEPDRGWVWIPTELDISFDFMYPGTDPIACDWMQRPQHFEIVLADANRRSSYIDAIERTLTVYDADLLENLVDSWSDQISDSVEEDPSRPFDFATHTIAVGDLRMYFAQRTEFIESWIGCARTGLGSDDDNDGTPFCNDCADYDNTISPTSPEICNQIDDNCDSIVDEGC